MEIFSFRKETGKNISKFHSNFIIARIAQSDGDAHIHCMHLPENGIIGHHQAVVPQLLMVVEGEGWVKGEEDEYIAVKTGYTVFWRQDEWHETKTKTGLTAIVIESEAISPWDLQG